MRKLQVSLLACVSRREPTTMPFNFTITTLAIYSIGFLFCQRRLIKEISISFSRPKKKLEKERLLPYI